MGKDMFELWVSLLFFLLCFCQVFSCHSSMCMSSISSQHIQLKGQWLPVNTHWHIDLLFGRSAEWLAVFWVLIHVPECCWIGHGAKFASRTSGIYVLSSWHSIKYIKIHLGSWEGGKMDCHQRMWIEGGPTCKLAAKLNSLCYNVDIVL